MESPAQTILVVDDVPANVRLLGNILKQSGYDVRPTTSGKRALSAAEAKAPDLVLLDINMPEMDGYEVCRRLKEMPQTADVPVIFISAYDDPQHIVQGFDIGGVDYVTKPFRREEVLARVRTHLKIEQQRHELAEMSTREINHLTQINQFKDDILRIITHDLKNPIAIVQAFGELILEQAEDASLTQEDLIHMTQNIINAAQNMNTLIQDLLKLSRVEGQLKLNLQEVPLAGFLKIVAQNTKLESEAKEHTFTYHPPADDLTTLMEPTLFKQVIQNLLSNAVKYTPPGGTITLSAEKRETAVLICVRDTGLGIPQEALPHIFDKFYRVESYTHREQTGTGLGLSIVKAIVEQHGGRIDVDSQENVGTTFTILLPTAVDSESLPTNKPLP